MEDPRHPDPGKGPLLSVRGITLAFGPKVIQRDLSFDVRRGSIFAVMGGSGCGKSTVLKAMIGLLRPTKGTSWSMPRTIGPAPRRGAPRSVGASACCFRAERSGVP